MPIFAEGASFRRLPVLLKSLKNAAVCKLHKFSSRNCVKCKNLSLLTQLHLTFNIKNDNILINYIYILRNYYVFY